MLSSVTLLSNSFFKKTFPYSAMNWRHIKAQQEIRNICFPFSNSSRLNFIYTYIRTHQTHLSGHTVFGHGVRTASEARVFRHVSRCSSWQ